MSHSRELALLAVSKCENTGIDIEAVRAETNWMELTKYVFSSVEIENLKNQPENQRTNAFFDLWTRKEAFIKVVGKGLSLNLKTFSLFPADSESSRLIFHDDSLTEIED